MNRDKLKIPEFIQFYLKRHNFIKYYIVPSVHGCGNSYIRFPYSYDIDFLYSKEYDSELKYFLSLDFEVLCPKCNKPFGDDNGFAITLIDLDSKEVFVNSAIKRSLQNLEFEIHGFKVNIFETIDKLKNKLFEIYKIDRINLVKTYLDPGLIDTDKGKGTLEIYNRGSYDAVIKLIELKSQKAFYFVSIKENSKYTISNIPDGEYIAIFITGKKWNSSKNTFKFQPEYFKFQETFIFKTTFVDNHTYSRGYKISLEPKITDTFRINNANKFEFDKY